jgi:hypothetical protein
MCADTVGSAVHVFRHRVDHLIAEGRQLRASLSADPEGPAALAALGVWQRECAATIGQLSGGAKTHWLARAYSEAFLVPMAPGASASVTLIVERVLGVLDRAGTSLATAEEVAGAEPRSSAAGPASQGRFSFVDDAALRPHLEGAYRDGQLALSRGDCAVALVTFCSILDAAVTYTLERRGTRASDERTAARTFAERIAAAERAGLISGGCVRLPAIAVDYRSLLDARGAIRDPLAVSARHAQIARQVLHVILRDLAPGR